MLNSANGWSKPWSCRQTVASYEALQTYEAPPEANPIDAFVIGESSDAFSNSMIVNAGRNRNVESGQAVVSDEGLIGRIVETGARASRVLLLTDAQSLIPVYVEGGTMEGLLGGKTTDHPTIEFTQNDEPVEVIQGQRILTSGAGGVLPRGLPVGVVARQTQDEVVVNLYANYARTRMVRIINFEFPTVTPPVEPVAPEGEETEGLRVRAKAPTLVRRADRGPSRRELIAPYSSHDAFCARAFWGYIFSHAYSAL